MRNYLFVIIATVALSSPACKKDSSDPTPPKNPDSVAVTEIILDKSAVVLQIEESVAFVATVNPEDATNKELEWTIADTSIATIENCVVTGVATGETTLTVKAKDGSGVTACATITVAGVEPTGVTFDGGSNAKFVTWFGHELDLKAVATPANADLRLLTWRFLPSSEDFQYEQNITSHNATLTAYSTDNKIQSVMNILIGSNSGSEMYAQIEVAFRTVAYLFSDSNYSGAASYWTDTNKYSDTINPAFEKYYFVAYCAPLEYSPLASPETYFPNSYIPTSEYTLTSNTDKITIKKLNDKCYEVTDTDISTYKELVLTYTCGKHVQKYTSKIVPQ